MEKTTKGTGAYIRLTAEESVKTGLSAPAQRRDAREYAQRANLPVPIIYEEPRAVGGDVPFHQRAAGKQLITAIKNGELSDLVVRDMDRLARDVSIWIELRDLCYKQGVTIHTFSGPLLNTSPSDRFSTTVRAAAAALEREQTGDRIRRVRKQLAVIGRHGGGPPTFGYTSQAHLAAELKRQGKPPEEAQITLPLRGHLYIDPVEAETVRIIFDFYVNKRQGCKNIAKHLNNLGKYRRSGKPWHPDKVRRVIRDPILCGYIPHDQARYEDQRIRTGKPDQQLYEGKHEPIITREEWRKAQEIRIENLPNMPVRPNRHYLLAGIIRCACGSPMKAIKSDKIYFSYVCRKRKTWGDKVEHGGCLAPAIHLQRTDDGFWLCIQKLMASPTLIDRVHAAIGKLNKDRKPVNQSTQKLEADLARWYQWHDQAESDTEKQLAWRRIIEIGKTIEQVKSSTPVSAPKLITREKVVGYLGNLRKLMEGKGKELVSLLAKHHGLLVKNDGEKLTVSLAFSLGDSSVRMEESVEIPAKKDEGAEWVKTNTGKHKCEECGGVVKIKRRHFKRGIPRFCSHACCCRKLAPARGKVAGFLSGADYARKLKVSRTQFGRMVKAGKIPAPSRTASATLKLWRA